MTVEQKEPRKKLTPTQARAARRARRQARRRLIRIGAFTVVGIIAVLFIAALFLPSIPLNFSDFGRPANAGEKVADQGNDHVDPGEPHPTYSSVPATSGWHYGVPLAPARWGVHTEPLPDEVLVHNLEHGGIGVHYNCPNGCDALVQQLTQLVERAVNEENLKVVMSPYPNMDTTIALTAWHYIDKLTDFDEERIKRFIRAHESSSEAPEPFAR